MKWISYALVFMAFIRVGQLLADEPPIPSHMAVVGDSISEALLSEYSVERPPRLGQLLSLIGPFRRAVGGERINIFRQLFAKIYHSWATGDDKVDYVFSHFERLKLLNPDLTAKNYAISGDPSYGMFSQIDKLLEDEHAASYTTDYLLVLFGGNDMNAKTVSEMVSPGQFAFNIRTNLQRILDADPHRSILLVGLPKIHEIFEKSENLAAYRVLGIKIKCDQIRRFVYGRQALFSRKQDPWAYEGSKVVASMYRSELDRVRDELKVEYPMAAIKSVNDYDAIGLLDKTLSADCFHPSAIGQALLAEATWVYGFWPERVTEVDYFGQ